MFTGILLNCCLALPLAQAEPDVPQAGVALKAMLNATRPQYLLGEPVLLNGSLKNVGKQPFRGGRADVPAEAGLVQILFSDDNVRFERYNAGIYGQASVFLKAQTLKPGDEWKFQLRILYAFQHDSRLAFERPGTYFVKFRYPVITPSQHWREPVESNGARVEIKAPQGADARVWEELRKPEFVYFLHCGLVKMEHPELLPRAIELVRTLPKSAYHAAIKGALQEHYRQEIATMDQPTAQEVPELDKIREVLGIPKPPAGPFPEDQRLDQQIICHFPQSTPLEEALQVMSAQSGVGLSVSPALKEQRVLALGGMETLRHFMWRKAGRSATWVPYGDGYRLVPAPKPK